MESYSPQPYEHLAAVLRKSGHVHDARQVSIAKHDDRRRVQGVVGKAASYCLKAFVSHG